MVAENLFYPNFNLSWNNFNSLFVYKNHIEASPKLFFLFYPWKKMKEKGKKTRERGGEIQRELERDLKQEKNRKEKRERRKNKN